MIRHYKIYPKTPLLSMRFCTFTSIPVQKGNEAMRKSLRSVRSRYKKEILGDTGVMEVLEYEQ